MGGIHSDLHSLLDHVHKLNSTSNIEAYISRLSKFDIKFDQLIDNMKLGENKGANPSKLSSVI